MCFDESEEFQCQRTTLLRALFETHRVRAEHGCRGATLGITWLALGQEKERARILIQVEQRALDLGPMSTDWQEVRL